MTLTVVTIMGGLGRVVIGSDAKPAHVGAVGPLYIRDELVGPVLTETPTISPLLGVDSVLADAVFIEDQPDPGGAVAAFEPTTPVP